MDYPVPIPPNPPEERSAEPSRSADQNPIFDLHDVLWIAGVAVASLFLCTSITLAILSASHPPGGDIRALAGNALVLLPAQLASYIMVVAFMALLMWHKYRSSLREAVHWNMPAARLAWGAFASGAALGLATQFLSGLLQRWIPNSLPIEQYFRTPASAYALAAFGILVAPLVEELFFRGFLYPALARPLGIGAAIALTAGGFALIHAQQLAHALIPLIVLFTIGFILTAVRAKTNSVAVCVFIHMGYNSMLFTLLYFATQGFRHMEHS